jgi:hypothetical protein
MVATAAAALTGAAAKGRLARKARRVIKGMVLT